MSPSSPLASERPAVLVIAATDSSGGAGLIRDVRVLTDHSVDALCAVTAVTAQSDTRVWAIHHVPPDTVRKQIAAALETRKVGAVKIGMLGTCATVDAVAAGLAEISQEVPVVLDPVLVSSSGGILLDTDGRRALRERLFPRVSLVTPNVPEAAALLDEPVAPDETSLIRQGQRLLALGMGAVLLKGGHWTGSQATDLLISHPAGPAETIMSSRMPGSSRGTGCALASSIAAGLASGRSLLEACCEAKQYVMRMLTPAG